MPADAYKALNDATRRHILDILREKGDLSAGEIAAHFSISAPSVSHHLSVLKHAGLVTDTRRGQTIVYSLNTTVFQDILQWVCTFTKDNDEEAGG